jgi:hypothetical protein
VKDDLQSYYHFRKGTEAEGELIVPIRYVLFIAVRTKQIVFAEYF